MATRRMFSHDIIASDAFLDMPMSSRELYFHLGMYADDDGFVNPKKIIRMIGASSDDLKVLVAKRFVLEFESGVVVIKHWLIHNLIRNDRYKETMYLEEKKALIIKENKAYSELETTGIPNGNQMATQVRIGKDRKGKKSIVKDTLQLSVANSVNKLFEIFQMSINPTINYANKTQRKAAQELIDLLGEEKATKLAQYACSVQGEDFAPVVTTPYQLKEKIAQIRLYWTKSKTPKQETKGIVL